MQLSTAVNDVCHTPRHAAHNCLRLWARNATDGWDSDPFEPVRKDGKLYGRGVCDDKIHAIMIVKAVESFLQSGECCPVNLKVIIEGDEEGTSRGFIPWIKANAALLESDYCLVCDGGMASPDQPSICYGLRGGLVFNIDVRGPSNDLHSGAHGGCIHNPAQVVAELIAGLHDESGRISVPGFYDDVVAPTDDEREFLNKVPLTETELLEITGAPKTWGEQEYSLIERSTIRPTLEINGIFGGYSGDGIKMIIPAHAGAKISCRLVENQKPAKLYELISDHLKSICPSTVNLKIECMAEADPVSTALDGPLVESAKRAYQHHWGAPMQYRRMGGSVPMVPILQNELNIPCLLIGFNVPGSFPHGANENIHIELFKKGIDTLTVLFRNIGSV